ncbi:MAG TPA: FAD-binding oxidoreductase [Candidatus Limnocylindria bacterium]
MSIHSARLFPLVFSMLATWLAICSSTVLIDGSCDAAGTTRRRPTIVADRQSDILRRVDRLDRTDAELFRADVVVVGGGIIGCAATAIMADRGARVILVEGSSIGAGASGRNLGAIQHPFDPVLVPLYEESLTRYRALADAGFGDFTIGRTPAGLLLLNRDAETTEGQVQRISSAFPELDPTFLAPDDLAVLEPSLAAELWAVSLATGYPVPPAAATHAWAELAGAGRGAGIILDSPARVEIDAGRAVGVVLDDGTRISAGAVLVAAGPWTPRIVDPTGTWQPIAPTYGVTLQLRLDGETPRSIVEEDEVDTVNRAATATERASEVGPDVDPPTLFSLATAGGVSTLGSTFLPVEPDASRIEPLLLRRAAAFLPGIARAEVIGRRMCARPQSVDGHPFIGAVDGPDRLFVCAGHGPWGISTGPATAAIVARAILDGTPPPPELAAARPIEARAG